jgi:hypothetical protein
MRAHLEPIVKNSGALMIGSYFHNGQESLQCWIGHVIQQGTRQHETHFVDPSRGSRSACHAHVPGGTRVALLLYPADSARGPLDYRVRVSRIRLMVP